MERLPCDVTLLASADGGRFQNCNELEIEVKLGTRTANSPEDQRVFFWSFFVDKTYLKR